MKIKILKIEPFLAIRSDFIESVELREGIVLIETDSGSSHEIEFVDESRARTAYNRFVSEWHETLSGE